MLIISIARGFFPFGDTSVLVADMRYQFVDYYGYLKSIFFGDNTFYYSFSKTFGGDMLGFSSYYLNSLCNLFLLFFPNEYLPAGILFMAIIMMGLCGLTFNMMLDKLFTTRWASLIFSTSYAFMGFMLAYFNCTHYFFNIMLLPLVIRGLCNMVKTGKISILYIISLFLAVFSNYYIGYMTCLFTVIFFVYYVFSEVESLKEVLEYKNALISYVISSIIAVAMSAFTLLPVVFSLSGQKGGVSEAPLSFFPKFNFFDFFAGLYSTSFNGNISDGLPIIYCGVATVVFLILFLTNKSISRIERVASAAALLAMMLCFYINTLNIIWHGFNEPIGFPYRDSFFFSFLVIFIGYKGFINMHNSLGWFQGILCVCLFAIYSLYMLLSHNQYVGRDQIVITGAIIFIVLFFIYGYRNKKDYVIPLIVGLFILQSVDLLYNGYVSIGTYFYGAENDPTRDSIETFADYVRDNEEIIDKIKSDDSDFYRIEKTYRRSHNDAMLLNYNGLTHFSSCETEQVKDFMESMGYRNNGNWAMYGSGSTTFADSFMGMKYLLSQYDETSRQYESYMNMNGKYIYKNPYALPIMFGTEIKIKDIKPEDYDEFTYQNAIASSFGDEEYKIYNPVQIDNIELNNVNVNGDTYSIIDKEEDAYISYNLTALSKDFIFMYFDAPEVQNATIVINGLEKEPYFSTYGWSIREVGRYQSNEPVEVRIYLNQDEIIINDALFYSENPEELDKWYEKASSTKTKLDKISSSHLIGEAECSKDQTLVFSIPYEESWTIKVDGEIVNKEKVLNALMAIDVTAGSHTIEMKYMPKGLAFGTMISVLALGALVFLIIYNRKKQVQ